MKITKKSQYGLLFCLYVLRAGRAKIEDAAANLNLSTHFLEQIARTLRVKGVLKAVKGPGGGYEAVGDPTVLEVLSALDNRPLITDEETRELQTGGIEQRSLGAFIGSVAFTLNTSFNTKLSQVGAAQVKSEVNTMVSVNESVSN